MTLTNLLEIYNFKSMTKFISQLQKTDEISAVGYATLHLFILVFLLTGTSVLFGVGFYSSLIYSAYVLIYLLFPGLILIIGSTKTQLQPLDLLLKALVVGSVLNMLIGLLTIMVGIDEKFTKIYPLLFLVITYFTRNRIYEFTQTGCRIKKVETTAYFITSAFLVFSASLYNFDTVVDQHFTWVAAFANSFTSFPPQEPFINGVPLYYHYLYNIHINIAADITKIETILISSRLSIIFFALVFILSIYNYSKNKFSSGWPGILSCISLLMTFGYTYIMWRYFHMATASIMYRVASTLIAFSIFVVLIDEIAKKKEQRINIFIILMLIIGASGTRANLLPMLAGGIGFLFLFQFYHKLATKDSIKSLSLVIFGILFGAIFFLGFGGSNSDGTKLLIFNPLNLSVSEWAKYEYSPIVTALQKIGAPTTIAALSYIFISLIGRTTFLFPGLINFFRLNILDTNSKVLIVGVSITGLLLLLTIETVVAQEIWAFYWYVDIVLSIIGGAGFFHLLKNRKKLKRIYTYPLLLIAAVLGSIQVIEFSIEFQRKFTATSFPTAKPIYTAIDVENIVSSLREASDQGDVLVVGGSHQLIDDRIFPALIPGINLYASRVILPVYAARTAIDPNVSDKMWLLENDLSSNLDRSRIKNDIDSTKKLFLLWIGETDPIDRENLSKIGFNKEMSLWKVDN